MSELDQKHKKDVEERIEEVKKSLPHKVSSSPSHQSPHLSLIRAYSKSFDDVRYFLCLYDFFFLALHGIKNAIFMRVWGSFLKSLARQTDI